MTGSSATVRRMLDTNILEGVAFVNPFASAKDEHGEEPGGH
jgi:hypothetical protein